MTYGEKAATDAQRPATSAPASEETTPATNGGLLAKLPFDPLRVVDGLLGGWWWCVLAGLVLAAAGFGYGYSHLRSEYSASLQLIRQEPPNAFRVSESGEAFKPRTLTAQTFVSLMRGPNLIQRVTETLNNKESPAGLLKGLNVVAERNTDIIRLEFLTPASPQHAVSVLNTYASAVAEMTRELQTQEASTVNNFLKQQIARADEELKSIQQEQLAYGREANLLNAEKELDASLRKLSDLDLKFETTRIDFETIDLRIASTEKELAKHSPMAAKLQGARDELASLLARYTEQNPIVAEQRAKIKKLEEDVTKNADHGISFPQNGESGVANSLFLELVGLRSQRQVLAEQVKKLDLVRQQVSAKLSELPEKEMHLGRIKARQQSVENARAMLASRQREAELFEKNSLGYYRMLASAEVENVTTFSRTKKLMIFAIAGLFGGIALAALWLAWRSIRGGRLLTPIDARRAAQLPLLASLPAASSSGTRCEAWSFRTWTTLRQRLIADDGRGLLCGWLALHPGISTRWIELFGKAATLRGNKTILIATFPEDSTHSLEDALTNPDALITHLNAEHAIRLRIPENFAWTSQNRLRWKRAAAIWLHADATVLIEITGPGEPESVLLAETLPHIVCLARSGDGTSADFAEVIAPYRDAGCRMTGVALDCAPILRPAWLSQKIGAAVALLLGGILATHAAEIPRPVARHTRAAVAERTASAVAPTRMLRAPWQERLTLGPGDSMSISMYGQPDLTRSEIFVGPDGCVTYLYAQNVQAAGLTIDELRARLNEVMGRYYQNPRVIVTPTAFQSKRVYLLGKIVDKGIVVLDRPMTILEAVAAARGLEVGLYQLNTVELADLPRSLLVRRGRKMPVDFEKLFLHGDLTQNLPLEPDDYLYFPSSNTNEFHVLGSVKNPGTQGLTSQSTVVSALTTAGSFTDKAWRQRVLVVRGSLDKPQTFVVDVKAVLSGRAKDFRLEPRDIVYVSDHPWDRAVELLDLAVGAFTQAAVATWTGANIGPAIARPLLPQL